MKSESASWKTDCLSIGAKQKVPGHAVLVGKDGPVNRLRNELVTSQLLCAFNQSGPAPPAPAA